MVLETKRLDGGLLAATVDGRSVTSLPVLLATIVRHNREEDETVRTTLTIRVECHPDRCPLRELLDGIGNRNARFRYDRFGTTWEGNGRLALLHGALRCSGNCSAIFEADLLVPA